MTRIIVVRHGESEGNATNVFLGHTNMDLTEQGRLQAEKTAEYLEKYNIDAVYSSDLDRAVNTAEPTAKRQNREVIADKGLREIYAGVWEAVGYYALAEQKSSGFMTWMRDIDNAVCEQGESVAEMKARVTGAVDSIAKNNDRKTVAVFTHAAVVKALFSAWTGRAMRDIDWVKNASVTIVEYDGIDKVRFVETDYAEHLAGIVTFLPKEIHEKIL